jgi:hypothetical protein
MDLYIILPGKLGDIIICIPIAKHYSECGYKIIWPVDDDILSNFQHNHVPYINFIEFKTVDDIYTKAKQTGGTILDLSLSGPPMKNYRLQNIYSFDEYRYKLSGVCFNEKWRLDITRNIDRESILYDMLDIRGDYILTHTTSSKRLDLDIKTDMRVINMERHTDCIFDWINIIQNARALFFIESCFSNLTDQLSIDNELQVLYPQPRIDEVILFNGRLRCLPVLRNGWFHVK